MVGGELRWEMKGKNTGKKRKSLKNPRVDLESFDVSATSVTSSDGKCHNSSKGGGARSVVGVSETGSGMALAGLVISYIVLVFILL